MENLISKYNRISLWISGLIGLIALSTFFWNSTAEFHIGLVGVAAINIVLVFTASSLEKKSTKQDNTQILGATKKKQTLLAIVCMYCGKDMGTKNGEGVEGVTTASARSAGRCSIHNGNIQKRGINNVCLYSIRA